MKKALICAVAFLGLGLMAFQSAEAHGPRWGFTFSSGYPGYYGGYGYSHRPHYHHHHHHGHWHRHHGHHHHGHYHHRHGHRHHGHHHRW